MTLSVNHFLAVAEVISTAGTCSRRQVGAILVQDRRIVSTGYNGAPSGMDHCEHPTEPIDWNTEGNPCGIAVHAELNAIAFAARHGIKTEGAMMYCTDEPCLKCAQAIVNAGIYAVVYMKEYHTHDGKELLAKAGITAARVDGPKL